MAGALPTRGDDFERSTPIRPPRGSNRSSLAYVDLHLGHVGPAQGRDDRARAASPTWCRPTSRSSASGPGDRVVQGSSAAYDSSIEETGWRWRPAPRWSSPTTRRCASGPTWWPGCRRAHHRVLPAADAAALHGLPRPRARRCPSCACSTSAARRCRRTSAERWARGRTLDQRLRADRDDGDGRARARAAGRRQSPSAGPIAGVAAWVLDAERQRRTHRARPGELCLGGAAWPAATAACRADGRAVPGPSRASDASTAPATWPAATPTDASSATAASTRR